MKLSNKLTPVALAVSMIVGAALPGAASAEVGYNATVSSMYLWRGLDVSNGPTVSGGIDYSHESGAYASIWASSGVNGSNGIDETGDIDGVDGAGYETDIWVGFAGEVEGVGYDISYWNIDYPQADGDAINELALGLSFEGASFGYVMNTDSDNDYTYMTLGYNYDAFGIMYGASDDGAGAEYSHVNLSYSATDALSFTLSLPSDDTAGISEEELMMVSYSLPL